MTTPSTDALYTVRLAYLYIPPDATRTSVYQYPLEDPAGAGSYEILHPVIAPYFQSLSVTDVEGYKKDSVTLMFLGMPRTAQVGSRRIALLNDLPADSRIVVSAFGTPGAEVDFGRYVVSRSSSSQAHIESVMTLTGSRLISNQNSIQFLKDTAKYQARFGQRFQAGYANPASLTNQFNQACSQLPYPFAFDGYDTFGQANLSNMANYIDYKVRDLSHYADIEAFLNSCGVGIKQQLMNDDNYKSSGLENYDRFKSSQRKTNAKKLIGENVSILYPLYDGLIASATERGAAKTVYLEEPLGRTRSKQGLSPTVDPLFYARYELWTGNQTDPDKPSTGEPTSEESERLIYGGVLYSPELTARSSAYVFSQRIYGSREEALAFAEVAKFETRLNAEMVRFAIRGDCSIKANDLLQMDIAIPSSNGAERETIYIRARELNHIYSAAQGFRTTVTGLQVY